MQIADSTTDGKFEISSAEDVLALIEEHYPDGLESAYRKDFFEGGAYIGFNLCRYGYTERLAAELHTALDQYRGATFSSYGFGPMQPRFQQHHDKDGNEWFEVTTG